MKAILKRDLEMFQHIRRPGYVDAVTRCAIRQDERMLILADADYARLAAEFAPEVRDPAMEEAMARHIKAQVGTSCCG